MIKKILSVFLMTMVFSSANANIFVDARTALNAIKEHVSSLEIRKKVVKVYNEKIAKNKGTLDAEAVSEMSDAAGWDKTKDNLKRKAFRIALMEDVYGAACEDKYKNNPDFVCVTEFAATTVNMLQAQGLAQLYAYSKFDDTIQCGVKARMVAHTTTSVNPHAMGMSSTSYTPYVQCKTLKNDELKFYEFKFSNVDGNIDSTNHKNFKTNICKIFDSKYVTKNFKQYTFDVCEDIPDEETCSNMNDILGETNTGYITSWGPKGAARLQTLSSYDSCMLYEQVSKDSDGYLLYERTAFGLDGRVFLKAGVQRKGSKEIIQQIRSYVENTMGKENVESFDCEKNYHTIKLKDRSGTDDMVPCTINDKIVDFFFDDLSESWTIYDDSGREAMNCVAWGGTFTGKKCIGLDEQMCNTVREANSQQCPECKLIQWNEETKICELPSSASATSLKKGLNYTAIVGGAVVGVAITLGTLGAATAPTALILTGLAVETLGAGIELVKQIEIDETADEFFTKSANCYDEQCAEDLIIEYLNKMSNQQNDMLEEELSAADAELERLADLIPAESEFYQKMFVNGTDLESNETGEWTDAQIWRAIGIGMQSITVLTGIGKWIIKKSSTLQKGLQRTTTILTKKGNALRNAKKAKSAGKIAKAADAGYMGKLKGWRVKDIKVAQDNGVNIVYKFTEENSGKVYYLKSTDELDEIKRTKRAYEILNGKSDIVHIVNVVEDNQDVLIDFTKKLNLKQLKKHYWFLTQETPATHSAVEFLGNFDNLFKSELKGKPITLAEQEEIMNAIKILNDNGMRHGDLYNNMHFMRQSNGKLRVDIIDFEPWSFKETSKNHDFESVQSFFEEMAKRGGAETKSAAKTANKADDVAKGTAKTMNVSYKETNQLAKAGKWADATVLDPTFDIKVTPLELGGKKYYLKAGNTETLIQNEISRTKQAHELLKHNKIVTSVGVVEDDQTVLKAFMDAHPDITLPRTPDTQYFIMEATHVDSVDELRKDAEILECLRNKPITIEEQNIILSEIQNMNNNGLIHNDIWHNFAIYRDSGGNLHMELMDFGDFTAEEKLRRSNDDVLEIKKLFSKWSDRGLVEKGAAETKATKATNVVKTEKTAKGTQKTAIRDAANVETAGKPGAKNIKPVINQENVNEIILRNHEISKQEQDYVRQVYHSGPEGKKWVELWDERAPKNESLEHFQKAFGNDLSTAEKQSAKLDNGLLEEAERNRKEAMDNFNNSLDKYKAKNSLEKWQEYMHIRDANANVAHLTPKTQGLEKWTQAEIDEAEKLYIARGRMFDTADAYEGANDAFVNGGVSYSTYDINVTRINNKYKPEAERFNKEYREIEQAYKSQHGTTEGFKETAEYKKWQSEADKVAEQYQYELGQIALTNKDKVAKSMAFNLDDMLLRDVNLGRRVDSWGNLSKEEKINLLQDIIDSYATKYDTPRVKILSENIPIRDDGFAEYGHYTQGTITFNTNSATGGVLDMSTDDVFSALLHEYGHAIDHLSPNKGSVGGQIMKNNLFYTSKGPSYVLSPTEQSSYSISGAVKNSNNWPLRQAEDWKYLKELKQKATLSPLLNKTAQ